jgi:predicted Zn-dependent peptidase
MLKPMVLKNGLTVIRNPKHSTGTFLCGFVTMTGSANESGNTPNGITHLVERLFRFGTDKHPSSKSLTTALESIGAQYYSQTTQEYTQFYIVVPTNHQYKAISILAEIIQHSYFDTRDIETEKRNIIEEIKAQETTQNSLASDLALSNLYKNHPLGRSITGSIETIMSITKADIDDFLYHQYHSNRSYLVLGGNFETKNVMELVDQEWGYWNPKNRKFLEQPNLTLESIENLPRIQYRQKGIPFTDIAISFLLDEGLKPQLPPQDVDQEGVELTEDQINELKESKITDLAQLMVLNTILGQGYSSKLWSKGVEEELNLNTVQSDLIFFKNSGYLQILARTDSSQFTFGLESIFTCIESLKQATVSSNELAKSKEYLKGKLIMLHEDLLHSTIWNIEFLLGSSLIFSVHDLIEKINKIEANVVRSRALDIFIPDRMAITTLGTIKETKLIEKIIQKFIY